MLRRTSFVTRVSEDGDAGWLESPAARPRRATLSAAAKTKRERTRNGRLSMPPIVLRLVDDSVRGGESDDQEHEEQNQEQAGKELRNRDRKTKCLNSSHIPL